MKTLYETLLPYGIKPEDIKDGYGNPLKGSEYCKIHIINDKRIDIELLDYHAS